MLLLGSCLPYETLLKGNHCYEGYFLPLAKQQVGVSSTSTILLLMLIVTATPIFYVRSEASGALLDHHFPNTLPFSYLNLRTFPNS